MNRNTGLDILKFICSFMVVFMHAPVSFEYQEYVISICRIAVPVFFMITGYFYNDEKKEKNNKSILKITKYLVWGSALYFSYELIITLLKKENVGLFMAETFAIPRIINFLLFNDNFFAVHLWYLSAILYVLIIVKFVRKTDWKIVYVATPLLLICDLIFGRYSVLIFGKSYELFYVRNFLFVGLPYFALGHFIKEYENSIYKLIISKRVINIVLIAVLICIDIIETRMFEVGVFKSVREHNATTTFIAFFVFLFFLNDFNDGRLVKFTAEIGRRYSTMIYIIHPMVISALFIMSEWFDIIHVYLIIRPFLTYGVTYVLLYTAQRVRTKNKK